MQEQKPLLRLAPKVLYELFLKTFEEVEGKKFIETEASRSNLKILIHYFLGDRRFLSSKLLLSLSEDSLKKGLLIMGGCGCGKSSMMRSFERLLGWRRAAYCLNQAFVGYMASELIELGQSFLTSGKSLYPRI